MVDFFMRANLSTDISCKGYYRGHRCSGFTLIELLMVIAVIAILAGITFGVSRGVQNAQARAKAKAELAVIAQALEQYKARYGDYPRHDSDDADYPSTSGEVTSTMLLYALTGRLSIDFQTPGNPVVSKVNDSLADPQVQRNPSFIDVTKFSYSGTEDQPEALIDPWGNPYVYWYRWENNPADWDVYGYHLYSTGPKGSEANEEMRSRIEELSGVLSPDFRETADQEGIIFAGE
jgi:prepilin-type N-terminal cleavage/methylation domain-containing protein